MIKILTIRWLTASLVLNNWGLFVCKTPFCMIQHILFTFPVFSAASETQLDDAKLAIERYIMSRIYTHAMFPNGDGDVLRDQ